MVGTALILGGSGRFGRHMSEALWNAGWRIKLFDRARDTLPEAARGVDVIVHGWNPAYPDWARDVLPLANAVIDAAKREDATVLLPGNVYVYGHQAPTRFAPDTAHMATNPLGRIRIEMEAAFREAGVRTIVLRAGDFLDTEASGNWFDKVMAPSLAKDVLTYPGDPDIPHAWAYLPDFARAGVDLINQRRDMPQFSVVNFPGYTMTGRQMAAKAAQVLERPIRVKHMSWLPIHLARPVWPLARYLREMRYLWEKPHFLDGETFDALLPGFTPTDPAEALARAIAPVLGQDGSHRPRQGGARQGRALPA